MEINFRNVNFTYDSKSKLETLKNINLTISESNEFISILGHTGSGKSTLVQLMNALIIPTSGNLTILNQEIKTKKNKNKNLKEIRKQIGLVFQFPEYQLFEETVLKDVMFGPMNFGKTKEEAEEIAIKTLKQLNVDESLYEKSPFNLSGGQKRKVAIAGILASDPDILILDEPTVGLDPIGRHELLELLKNIHETTNKTIILIMGELQDLGKLAIDLVNEYQTMYNGKEIELPNDFKNQVKEIFGNSVVYQKYTAIVSTASGLNIYLPNHWFYIASFFTKYYDELQKYKEIAFSLFIPDRIKVLKNSELNADEKLRINQLELSDESKNFIEKFLVDYNWWGGGKTIDRGDFYVSPILNYAKLVNASQSYVADLCAFLSQNKSLVDCLFKEIDNNKLIQNEEILFGPTQFGSNSKGFVTTAIVKIPISRAMLAITGAAPVPVPPPIPQVTNTMSAPLIASAISSALKPSFFNNIPILTSSTHCLVSSLISSHKSLYPMAINPFIIVNTIIIFTNYCSNSNNSIFIT